MPDPAAGLAPRGAAALVVFEVAVGQARDRNHGAAYVDECGIGGEGAPRVFAPRADLQGVGVDSLRGVDEDRAAVAGGPGAVLGGLGAGSDARRPGLADR